MAIEKVYCITGIDTDIGKTVATGLIAKSFLKNGIKVITQKIVQTGCVGMSEDIMLHRKLMGMDVLAEDLVGITCPYRFPVPCSPHLAAEIEGEEILCETITAATEKLLTTFESVLLEGVGGLSVPLNAETTLLDYLEEKRYPLVLVSSSRLGSINHTLGALELAARRNLEISAIVYNLMGNEDPRIVEDSRDVFLKYLKIYGFPCKIIDLPEIDRLCEENVSPDFYTFFLEP